MRLYLRDVFRIKVPRFLTTLLALVALVVWFFLGHYLLTPEDSWSQELIDLLLIAAIILGISLFRTLYRRRRPRDAKEETDLGYPQFADGTPYTPEEFRRRLGIDARDPRLGGPA